MVLKIKKDSLRIVNAKGSPKYYFQSNSRLLFLSVKLDRQIIIMLKIMC
jgi:hypothetical protein